MESSSSSRSSKRQKSQNSGSQFPKFLYRGNNVKIETSSDGKSVLGLVLVVIPEAGEEAVLIWRQYVISRSNKPGPSYKRKELTTSSNGSAPNFSTSKTPKPILSASTSALQKLTQSSRSSERSQNLSSSLSWSNSSADLSSSGSIKEDSSYNFRIPLSQIRAIRRHLASFPGFGTPCVIIQTIDGVWHNPLHFLDGGVRTFMRTIEQVSMAIVTRSTSDENLFLFNDSSDLFSRSRKSLKDLMDSTQLPIQDRGKPNGEAKPTKSKPSTKASSPPSSNKGGFMSVFENVMKTFTSSPKTPPRQHVDQVKGHSKAPGEIVANVSGVHLDLGTFELIDDDNPKEEKKALPVVSRGKILTEEEWIGFKATPLHDRNVTKLLEKIFYGGMEAKLRKEAWKFLLGYYSFDATDEENSKIREAKEKEYNTLKRQWETVSPEQESHWRKYRVNKERIEKDVPRTDPDHEFFDDKEGRVTGNVNMLYSILMSYLCFNWDLGYVQGMGDLLSPILVVMEDEVDSFWCFKSLMDEMAGNFDKDENGINRQLIALEKLLRIMDPDLHEYFAQKDCLNLYFVYRWLLLMFKREFDFDDVLITDVLNSESLSSQNPSVFFKFEKLQ